MRNTYLKLKKLLAGELTPENIKTIQQRLESWRQVIPPYIFDLIWRSAALQHPAVTHLLINKLKALRSNYPSFYDDDILFSLLGDFTPEQSGIALQFFVTEKLVSLLDSSQDESLYHLARTGKLLEASSRSEKHFQQRLFLSFIFDHLDAIKSLCMGKNIDFHQTIAKGKLPIHLAAKHAHLHILKFLCNEKNIDPNQTSSDGYTPLHYAVSESHLDIVKFLCNEKKYNLKLTPTKGLTTGYTAIHFAAYAGHLDILKFLCNDLPCDPNQGTVGEDHEGLTPLHVAIYDGHLHILQFLHNEKNINPNQTITKGPYKKETPMYSAGRNKHPHIMRYLASFGVTISSLKEWHTMEVPMPNFLSKAISLFDFIDKKDYEAALELLQTTDCAVNLLQAEDNASLFHLLAHHYINAADDELKRQLIIELTNVLIDKGANRYIKNKNGQYPYQIIEKLKKPNDHINLSTVLVSDAQLLFDTLIPKADIEQSLENVSSKIDALQDFIVLHLREEKVIPGRFIAPILSYELDILLLSNEEALNPLTHDAITWIRSLQNTLNTEPQNSKETEKSDDLINADQETILTLIRNLQTINSALLKESMCDVSNENFSDLSVSDKQTMILVHERTILGLNHYFSKTASNSEKNSETASSQAPQQNTVLLPKESDAYTAPIDFGNSINQPSDKNNEGKYDASRRKGESIAARLNRLNPLPGIYEPVRFMNPDYEQVIPLRVC